MSNVLIRDLINAGAWISIYDPVAIGQAEKELPKEWFSHRKITMAENKYHALESADALVLVTEWKSFRYPDLKKMVQALRQPIIFDG